MFDSERLKKDSTSSQFIKGSNQHATKNSFIGQNGPKLPPNFKYEPNKTKDKMKSVKPSVGSEKSKSADKTGIISLDKNEIEFGYDEKNKDSVLSFSDRSQRLADKTVVENKAFEQRDNFEGKFKSNDKEFKKSTVSLRYNVSKEDNRISAQLEHFSNKNKGTTKIDKILPFNDIYKDKEHLEALKDQRSKTDGDKSIIDKEISDINKIISEKQNENFRFSQKLKLAIEDTKNRSNMTFDEYILYVRKRLMEFEETGEDDDENKNKNNEENKTEETSNKGGQAVEQVEQTDVQESNEQSSSSEEANASNDNQENS